VPNSPKSVHAKLSPARATGFGVNVRQRRVEVGLTQEAAAAAAGLTPQYLSDIERGNRNPTLATVYALADAFDCTAAALLPE
jgi:transcriptional regulator with XRE-family HTH domain